MLGFFYKILNLFLLFQILKIEKVIKNPISIIYPYKIDYL